MDKRRLCGQAEARVGQGVEDPQAGLPGSALASRRPADSTSATRAPAEAKVGQPALHGVAYLPGVQRCWDGRTSSVSSVAVTFSAWAQGGGRWRPGGAAAHGAGAAAGETRHRLCPADKPLVGVLLHSTLLRGESNRIERVA